MSNLKTPKLTQEEIDKLLSDEPLRHADRIETLMSDYVAKFDKWINLLRHDFNIVTFGFGSKKGLLREFQDTKLADQDVIVINGFFPSLTIKHVLNAITEDILNAGELTFGGVPEQLQFILREMDSRDDEPLYLIVHNIDGPMLSNHRAQSVLAQMAAHPNVHLICSIDHINAPLTWDQQMVTCYNFVWFDTTTFLPYREETRNENSFLIAHSSALALSSLVNVFASLNVNAKAIYMKIVHFQLESQDDESDPNYIGIAFPDLYQKCRASFLVNSDLTLRAQLIEFKDHKLIQLKKGIDGIDYLKIPLKNSTLEEFVENQESN